MSEFKNILQLDKQSQAAMLADANGLLANMSAEQRVAWALDNLPNTAFLSSSFGIQAAVMLHLMTSQRPDIPVVLTDRAQLSPAWQEAKFGKLWEQGEDGIKQYNQLNKVEPMTRALKEIEAGTWFSGLRRDQSSTRADKQFVEISRGTVKVYPIIEWSNRDVYQYLTKHELEPGMTEE